MSRSFTPRPSVRRLMMLLAAFVLLTVACSDDGNESGDDAGAPATDDAPGGADESTTTAPTTTAPIPEGGEALEVLQLQLVEFGDAGYVEIVNTGAEPVGLAGVYICEFPDYADLGDILDLAELDAGATVQIPAEHLGGISADDGEAALYDGDDFGSADAMLSYVQWGSGGHERASVAVDAGLWPSVDAFVTPDPAFNSIESGGFAPDPEGWS